MAEPYCEMINPAHLLPSITDKSAAYIFVEIGSDITMFHSSKYLCSWAGLTPQNNESADKKRSARISRAGVCLKPLLIQCANAAVKDLENPYFQIQVMSIS